MRWTLPVVFLVLACSGAGRDPSAAVSPTELKTLFDVEPDSTPEEYEARTVTLRLFGVQRDDLRGAVFADTSNWRTREVAEGALLARNVRLAAVEEEGVVLELSSGGTLRVDINKDVTVRRIHHVVDNAVEYLGRGRFRVDSSTAQALLRERGLGAQGDHVLLHDTQMLKLVKVDPRGALALWGLESGDLLQGVTELPSLAERISRGARVELQVLRRGIPLWLTYAP